MVLLEGTASRMEVRTVEDTELLVMQAIRRMDMAQRRAKAAMEVHHLYGLSTQRKTVLNIGTTPRLVNLPGPNLPGCKAAIPRNGNVGQLRLVV